MFCGLLDLDPLVRGTDPEPDPHPSIISTVLRVFCDFLSLKDDVKRSSKSNKVTGENSRIRIR
jgi:hypothetical protein